MNKNSLVCVLSAAYMQHRMSAETPMSPEEFYEKYHEEYEDAFRIFTNLTSET